MSETQELEANNSELENSSQAVVSDVREIILTAKENAVRSVNFERVKMYWHIGERIATEELKNKERAAYGKYVIKLLAEKMSELFGSGFNRTNLYRAREFYEAFPIVAALRQQLSWTQYRMLLTLENKEKRNFYENEAVKNNWSGRELERQVKSSLYERQLLAGGKKSVTSENATSKQVLENPTDIIKGPMVLEFLDLKDNHKYREHDLESALIEHIQEFLLELGNGFSFVGRQKRICIGGENFYADLVFYNRTLNCHVIIEIKTKELKHQDIGQLQMYMNYYDRQVKYADENPTIGVLLCAAKNDEVVEYTLPEDNNTVKASTYELVMPSKQEFLEQVTKVEKELEKAQHVK